MNDANDPLVAIREEVEALKLQVKELKSSLQMLSILTKSGTITSRALFDTLKCHEITCARIHITDQRGMVRVSVDADPGTDPGIFLIDEHGETRIAATTGADGSAGILWSDGDGKVRIVAETDGDSNASLSMMNVAGDE